MSHDSYISRNTISIQNFSFIGPYLLELLLKNLQNWAELGHRAQKIRGSFWVKLRTTNTQTLKVLNPETMDEWSYYRLCENFCQPLGPTLGGNLGLFWAQKMGFLINFIRILRFIWDLELVSSDIPKDLVSVKFLVFGNIFIFPGEN